MTKKIKYYINKLRQATQYSSNPIIFLKFIFFKSLHYKFKFSYQGKNFYIRREDFVSLEEILEGGEYSIIRKFDKKKPHIVLDLGANVGLFSLYYLTNYPNSKVISVEASNDTFEVLNSTIALNPAYNWTAINKAVYDKNTTISFSCSTSSSARKILDSSVVNERIITCETITVNEIFDTIESNKEDYCVCVKMDIEGAEEKVILNNNNWLKGVDYLIIELHDVDRQSIIQTLNHYFKYSANIGRGTSSKPLLLFSKLLVEK